MIALPARPLPIPDQTEHNTMNRTTISPACAPARPRASHARALPAILACLCGLSTLAPAHAADALPPIIAPLWYGSTIDMTAGMANFSIGFDRRPDLLTVDSFLRQAD